MAPSQFWNKASPTTTRADRSRFVIQPVKRIVEGGGHVLSRRGGMRQKAHGRAPSTSLVIRGVPGIGTFSRTNIACTGGTNGMTPKVAAPKRIRGVFVRRAVMVNSATERTR